MAARLLRGMRRCVAALAADGNDLIVDDVMLEDELADYRRLLGDLNFSVVGVYASLEDLEAREKARGDRLMDLPVGNSISSIRTRDMISRSIPAPRPRWSAPGRSRTLAP